MADGPVFNRRRPAIEPPIRYIIAPPFTVGDGRPVLLGYGLNQLPEAGVLADGDGEADIHVAADDDQGVAIEVAVGPHRELCSGPAVAHPPHRLTEEVGGAPSGVGPALAQTGHQHLAGAGGNGQQRVIPSRAGVAVVACSLLGQSVGLADGRVHVDGQRRVAGSGPSGPCPGQQLAAHPVELTDMPPAKAAQEGAQGGWRLDHAAENTDRPTGAQRIGGVDAVAASQGGGDQRQHLVPRVRPSRRAAEVEALLDEFGQAEMPGQGGRKEQPGVGHQSAVVEGDLDAIGMVAWQHLLGAPFLGSVFVTKPLSQKHRSTFLPLQDANPTPSFGGFGLRRSTFTCRCRCWLSRRRY